MSEVLLGHDHGAKSSYLTMGLYSKDTALKLDLLTKNEDNDGLKTRTQHIKESKIVEVSGLLHCDLVNSNCLLLNGLPLKKSFTNRETVLY